MFFFFLLCRLVEEFRRTSAKNMPQKLLFFQDLRLSKKPTLGKKQRTTSGYFLLFLFIYAPLGILGIDNMSPKNDGWKM